MTTQEAEAILDQDLSEHIEASEPLEADTNPNRMGIVLVSPPLLERLDQIAIAEGQPRETLIQRVLWEFINAKDVAGSSPR